MDQKIKNNFRFEELDSLRGIASIIVLMYHFTMGRPEVEYGFELGVTGVDLFFIISGFVIFFSLERVNNQKQFLIKRFFRIFPTYWIGVTYTFLVILTYSIYTSDFTLLDVKQYLINLTMIQFYFDVKDLDGPYWTMLVELNFYVCVSIFYRFKKVFDLLFIFTIIFTFLLVYFYGKSNLIDIIYKIPMLQFTPLFYAGILFYKRKMMKISFVRFLAGCFLCFIIQLFLFEYAGKSHGQISIFQYLVMLSSYFIIFFLFIEDKLGLIVNKILLFLGKISFALYLIHYRVSVNFIIPILTKKFYFSFIFSSVIAFIITLLASIIITFYLEKVIVKLMYTFIKNIKYTFSKFFSFIN